MLDFAEMNQRLGIATNYRKVDEVPFDFERRRMSVVVSEREDHHELICKGAVEEMLGVCGRVHHAGRTSPLTPELLAEIRNITGDLNAQGLRVIAIATKDFPPTKEQYGVADECDLTLVGYIAFLDPPKESTAPALTALREHGVTVKVLTGDNALVTAKICKEVGLIGGATADGILLGAQVEAMSDAELKVECEKRTVFAKLSPAHKERIVRALHNNGHVVGFMGDGINDAPALRAADIGISVDTAVDIAKEAADIILLEKSLMVLEEGVLEGRRTFANMLKYIKMTASSNFGNVFSVLVASAFLPFLPMLPLQLLVQNLLYDVSQVAIPFDHVDAEFLAKPQTWNPADIGRFMFFFGPISSLFDLCTFALMWFVFGANGIDHQTLFQSGWFVEGLLSQTLIVHMIRTRKIPFIQSRAAWPLIGMTIAIVAVGIAIPMTGVAGYFRFEALPLAVLPVAGRGAGRVRGADAGGEGVLRTALRLAVKGPRDVGRSVPVLVARRAESQSIATAATRSCDVGRNASATNALSPSAAETHSDTMPQRSRHRPNSHGASACAMRAGTVSIPCRCPYPEGPKRTSGSVPFAMVRMPFPAPCNSPKTRASGVPSVISSTAPSGCIRLASRADSNGCTRRSTLNSRMRAATCAGPINAPTSTAVASVAPAASISRGRCAAIAVDTNQVTANT